MLQMNKYMPGNEAAIFKEWLQEDGLLGKFCEYSHAIIALPTDQAVIDGLNTGVRETKGCWYPANGDWLDDDWIIGEDGAGNFYVLSKSGAYQGVFEYLHECLEKQPLEPDIRAYYEYCIQIHRESGENAT